jgi:DNA polymerase
VLLGATAAQNVLGKGFLVSQRRGEVVETPWPLPGVATWHPASIVRAKEREDRQRLREQLVADLCTVAELCTARAALDAARLGP